MRLARHGKIELSANGSGSASQGQPLCLPLICSVLFLLSILTAQAQLSPNGATASFKGSLPPKPVAPLSAEQEADAEKTLADVEAAFASVKKHPRSADAAIFLKAVRYALDFDEWYDKKPEDNLKKVNALLDEAKKRIACLNENKTPWMEGAGQKVIGFYSKLDGSAQPYGVEIPEGLEIGKKAVPLWIWLHGRGDTATDLHFVYSRLMPKKPGQFQPAGSIVIHPFGRYCNGWKSAGEVDVFESRDLARWRDRGILAAIAHPEDRHASRFPVVHSPRRDGAARRLR